MKRLSLLELHKTALKTNLLGKIHGGEGIKCLCTFINPLVTTRDAGGTGTLCLCVDRDAPVSQGVQRRPISITSAH